jgi:hypothetical protein
MMGGSHFLWIAASLRDWRMKLSAKPSGCVFEQGCELQDAIGGLQKIHSPGVPSIRL